MIQMAGQMPVERNRESGAGYRGRPTGPEPARRIRGIYLLLRAHQTHQAGILLLLGMLVHVVAGRMPIAVPGTSAAQSMNAAILAGFLAGASAVLAVSSYTPWWAWGSGRGPLKALLLVLCVWMSGIGFLGLTVQLLTGQPAVAGWFASAGLALALLGVAGRSIPSTLLAPAVGLALSALLSQELPGVLAGLSAATWYDEARPLNSGLTPYALWIAGIASVLLRISVTRRGFQP